MLDENKSSQFFINLQKQTSPYLRNHTDNIITCFITVI